MAQVEKVGHDWYEFDELASQARRMLTGIVAFKDDDIVATWVDYKHRTVYFRLKGVRITVDVGRGEVIVEDVIDVLRCEG